MGVFSNIIGVLGQFFQIGGPSGPGLEANGGAVEVRAPGPGALTITRGAEPVGLTDYTTAGAVASLPAANMVADGVRFTDGAIVATTTLLTCATSAPFTPASVGKPIHVQGAGTSGTPPTLNTTIASYVSPTQVHLNVAATHTVTNASGGFGTDNGPLLQPYLTAQAGTGIAVQLPPGIFYFATGVNLFAETLLQGTDGTTLVFGGLGTGALSTLNCLFSTPPSPPRRRRSVQTFPWALPPSRRSRASRRGPTSA